MSTEVPPLALISVGSNSSSSFHYIHRAVRIPTLLPYPQGDLCCFPSVRALSCCPAPGPGDRRALLGARGGLGRRAHTGSTEGPKQETWTDTGLGRLLSFLKATNPEPSVVRCVYDPGCQRCFYVKHVRKVLFTKHLLQFDDT